MMNEYYVYEWFRISTGEIFHVGKGKGQRMFEEKAHRNEYLFMKDTYNAGHCIVRHILHNDWKPDKWHPEQNFEHIRIEKIEKCND